MKNLYLSNRFFMLFAGVILLFLVSFRLGWLYPVAIFAFCGAVGLVLVDLLLLFRAGVRLEIERTLPKLFSLGDTNQVKIRLKNLAPNDLHLTVVDELPIEFQKRDFNFQTKVAAGAEETMQYDIRPVSRGLYKFGAVNVFLETSLGLVQKRQRATAPMSVPVYPSIPQMKQYEMLAFDKVSMTKGIKKIRRIGHSYEFEQIKNYVKGDDYRSINWKATGRQNRLMVNQYEDERSQQVYCIIDKSRVMRMPFAGLSLLDYAINTGLVISNIILQKHDKAGLITFSDKIGTTLKAERSNKQLNRILQSLYNERERPGEANYELLYHIARKLINGRSMILLFTNFESMYALERVLPIMRRINNLHLLVPIFFENTEITDFINSKATTIEDIYTKTVARKFLTEKQQMVQKLRQYGIQSILTRPEDLSINTINKYLEMKSRGLI